MMTQCGYIEASQGRRGGWLPVSSLRKSEASPIEDIHAALLKGLNASAECLVKRKQYS